MKFFRPIIMHELDIRVPGARVRQLAVHQHLSETTAVEPHSHGFSQCLLYLSGQGRQIIRGEPWPVRSGTLVFLPPRVAHSFRREGNREPVCLVIDFDWRRKKGAEGRTVPLPSTVLRDLRLQISNILRLRRQATEEVSLGLSAAILRLLDELLSALTISTLPMTASSPVARRVEEVLARTAKDQLSLRQIAELAGFQHDHLNRLLKQQAGVTLGRLRARAMLAKAQALLSRPGSIKDAAKAAGFRDNNYFARWFRRQTGMSPREWRTRLK